jgi:hypothetical protein
MNRFINLLKNRYLGLAAAVAVGLGALAMTSEAQAQHGRSSHGGHYSQGGHGSHYGHSQGNHYGHGNGHAYGHRGRSPIYHPPSVHYHQRYHVDSYHWTPGRGLHTHGHIDLVPHYTPGHYDTLHNGHIHGNPYYHGR